MYCKPLSLLLASLLVGCGGGGGESSSNSSNGSNSTTMQTLSIMAKYKDGCGNETPASDAALLIHNSDYSNKEIIYADTNGKLTYTTTKANQTLSIIMRGDDDKVNGINPIYLTTYIDQPIVDMGSFYQNTKSIVDCQCQSFDVKVNVPNRINDIGRGRVSGAESTGNINNNIGYTNFTDALVCKDSTGSWPLISTLIDYNSPEQAFAAVIPDISAITETNADLESTVVNINSNDNEANKQVSTVIDGKYLLINSAYNSFGDVYGFVTDSIDFYSVAAYKFEAIYDIPDVEDAFLWNIATENSTNLNKTFDLTLPEMDYISLFNILVSESGQYDLSYVNNMDYVTVGIDATYENEALLSWMLYAPVSGEVPKIENIDLSAFISEGTLETSVDNITMYIDAQGYDGIDGYQDFMINKPEQSVENNILDKWSKFDAVYFEMTISNSEATNYSGQSQSSKVLKKQNENEVARNVLDKFFAKKNL